MWWFCDQSVSVSVGVVWRWIIEAELFSLELVVRYSELCDFVLNWEE